MELFSLTNICWRDNTAGYKQLRRFQKGFFEYISDKRETREHVGPLLNEKGDLAT